jgi:hypothetical protein
VDNRAGPGGGGAGTTNAGVTITVTLDPILNPIISTLSQQEIFNVGEVISFSALNTPNRSDQISESGYSWDVNADGNDDFFGPYLDYLWPNPDNASLKLSVISSEGIIASKVMPINIADTSPPNASISVNGAIQKGYNQSILISASFSDNWGVDRTEWLVDGVIKQSNYTLADSSLSSFSFIFDSDFQSGEHVIEFKVTDNSGQSSSDSVMVILSDITSPIFNEYSDQIYVTIGEPISFEVSAFDLESKEIQYSWIFNQGLDDEIQFSGKLVQYDFKLAGAQRVVCIAENNAGLSSEAVIIVNVLDVEIQDNSLNPFFIIMVILFILVIISILSFKLLQRRVEMRAKELSKMEEGPIEENKPPTTDEQKLMWGENSVMEQALTPPQTTQTSTDMNIEELLADAQNHSLPSDNQINDDLLSNLIDHKNSSPGPEPVVEEIINRTLKKNCSSCNLLFAVALPEGIDSARTACPKCGSIEDVSIL